jgi:hypothetical protein
MTDATFDGDDEFDAIKVVFAALEPLDDQARTRVVNDRTSRYRSRERP